MTSEFDQTLPASSSKPAPAIHGRFSPGQEFAGRYRIVSLLGRGGMGDVYRADDLQLGQSVALKFLPPKVAADPVAADRFKREVRVARGVTHPNVCRIHDIGQDRGHVFLSMEYVDGEDLASVLHRLGRPTQEKAMEIARQICLGLAAVHDAGILHRDLKPANIMIDGRGNVRLMDFGIASMQQDVATSSDLAGTPVYMAPELFKGGEASVQSDLYALGLVLYEVFTGKRAFQENDLRKLFERRDTTTPTAPSSLIADMDPLAERAILQCLEKDPKQRPSSAYALLGMLPGGDPLAAARAAGLTPSPEMVAAAGDQKILPRRSALLALLAILAGLVLIVLLSPRTHEINRLTEAKHPEVLAETARSLLRGWSYVIEPGTVASGFTQPPDKSIAFWFRHRPPEFPLAVFEYFGSWGRESRNRVTSRVPAWTVPGELGLHLDLSGELLWFRAIPPMITTNPPTPPMPPWREWFPPQAIGMDLATLEMVPDQALTPPDAYDRLQVWKGTEPGTEKDFYLQAAAYHGRPVYFHRMSPEQFERALLPHQRVSSQLQSGRRYLIVLLWLSYGGAAVLAWRNFRAGQSDRRGALRVAFYLFALGMLAWLLLAQPQSDLTMAFATFYMGVAQSMARAGFFWMYYIALEPFIRRLWPQTLISWSRLVEGRWKDPLVGRDLLVGIAVAVGLYLLYQLQVPLSQWPGLPSQPPLQTEPWTLEGPTAFVGNLFSEVVRKIGFSLLFLLFLVLIRLVVRQTAWVYTAFIALVSPIIFLLDEYHPVLGWPIVILSSASSVWLVIRFGFLALLAANICRHLLAGPLTLSFSAWYADSALVSLGLVAALAGVGYYLSRGGKAQTPRREE